MQNNLPNNNIPNNTPNNIPNNMPNNQIKVKKPFYKRWWFIVLAVFFVLGAISNALKSPEEKQKEAIEAQQKQMEQNEKTEKENIKKQIETVINDHYKKEKDGYSLDVLTLTEGGYSVSVQIPFGVETEESEILLSATLEKIKQLNIENLKEISLYAIHYSQIVNVVDFPENQKHKEDVIAEANKTKEQREANKRKEWISSQFSAWDGSHTTLTKLIKDNLNDEDSYKHIETTYIDISNDELLKQVNEILANSGYNVTAEIGDLVITTKFSAKNAFNATVKNSAIGIVKEKDNTVTLLGIE